MNLDYNTAFWFLIFTASLSLVGIWVTARGLSTLVKSDFFIDKMKEVRDSKKINTILILLLSTLPGSMMAEALVPASEPFFAVGYNEVVMMVVINLILLSVLMLLKYMISQLVEKIAPEKKVAVKEKTLSTKLSRALTDMVDIEEEKSILMDHDYDGIQELDNNLPPWWKYGFYLSIVVAFMYMIHFHVLGTGDLQAQEYEKEMAQAQADVDAYLKASALNVDETSAIMMTADADLSSGKGIFLKNCAVCHLNDGGGQVGPNMTDDYWMYGPDIQTMFKIIKYGAKNGMTSWKEKLTPIQIQQVASYIRTLHGTTPAIPKDPEGTLMPFDEDSISTPSDSVVVD